MNSSDAMSPPRDCLDPTERALLADAEARDATPAMLELARARLRNRIVKLRELHKRRVLAARAGHGVADDELLAVRLACLRDAHTRVARRLAQSTGVRGPAG